jgi:hypothetical protein
MSAFTQLCADCGFVTNHLTMVKRYGARSIEPMFAASTMVPGECDICGQEKAVAPLRDYFYPAERAMRAVKQYVTKGGEK